MKYFELSEFNCPCCGKNVMQPKFLKMLDNARGHACIPFVITSGYRCEKHNAEVGGVKNSSHLKGLAADIACSSTTQKAKIIKGLYLAGFTRVGIGGGFVHADCDPSLPADQLWTYQK